MISIGVDIGTFSIKVAEIEATSKSYSVRRLHEFPLSVDLTKDKKIEIIDTLRTLFQPFDPESTVFVFSIPQKYVSTRNLRLPFRERFKVQKAIISQLEDELPFSQDDAVFDAKITRYLGRSADVLTTVVPKERVGEVLDLAHDCGVEPLTISADGMGLNNLFERWFEAPPEGPTAIEQEIPEPRAAELVVNIGHLSTEMLVYTGAQLLAVRSIDWGAKNMADAIGAKYGLNYLQAVRELQSKGFVMLDKGQGTREQAAFSETIEAALAVLISEMRLKMLELQSEMTLQWTKANLLGGGSLLKNLGAYLTQSFEIPFNRYKQLEAHPAVNFEVSPQLEMTSATAVGLALEGLRRPRNPATSYLKGEFSQKSNFFAAVWEKWGYAAQLAALAFVILVIHGMMRESLVASLVDQSDAALRTQASAIAGLKGARANPTQIRSFIRQQENLEKSRKQAEKVVGLNSALDILTKISAAIPADTSKLMEIKRVSINNDLAEVHGYANSKPIADSVMKAIQGVAAGKLSSKASQIVVPAGKVGFSYSFKVNRGGG